MSEDRSAQPDPRMDVYASPQKLTPISPRRRINLFVAGQGEPTIILDVGLGGTTIDWGRVQPFASRISRVVSFDHAGLGFSSPGPLPRTSKAIVSDLRAALKAAGLRPPYVVVGHSAGGLHMRYFAACHPDEVAGLVLVDPAREFFEERLFGARSPSSVEQENDWRRLYRLAKAGSLRPETPEYQEFVRVPRSELTGSVNAAMHEMLTRTSYYRTLISESRELADHSSRQVAEAPQSLGDRPLIVLSAGRIGLSPFINHDSVREATWFRMHEEIAALSSAGVRRVVDAGHNIPIEAPRAVVSAIAEVVEAVRKR